MKKKIQSKKTENCPLIECQVKQSSCCDTIIYSILVSIALNWMLVQKASLPCWFGCFCFPRSNLYSSYLHLFIAYGVLIGCEAYFYLKKNEMAYKWFERPHLNISDIIKKHTNPTILMENRLCTCDTMSHRDYGCTFNVAYTIAKSPNIEPTTLWLRIFGVPFEEGCDWLDLHLLPLRMCDVYSLFGV